LKQFGSLRGLLQADREQFCAGNGLGDAKYAQLQAVLEMARRHLGEILARDDVFTSPQATRSYLSAQLRDLRNEAFVALFLDSKHRLIRFQVLFQGTVDGASVHPRVVVQRALELNAAALIIAHNHPSGIAEPSHADLHITQRLREALALVDIRLLDHLVVGDGAVISLAERGAL
jgi:DNA repair protein RadC